MRTRPSAPLAHASSPPRVERAAIPADIDDQHAERAERRAWVVLWVAFATFAILLSSGVRFVVDYVQSADIELAARVKSSHGDVEVKRPGGPTALWTRADRELPVGTLISPRRSATIDLAFFDGSTMTARYGAQVELARMDVGRFINRERLVINQTRGAVAYRSSGDLQVDVPNGAVHLPPQSQATVWVEDAQTRVLVYAGEARLESSGSTLVIPAERRGVLAADRRLQGPDPRPQELLKNGDFARRADGWTPIDVQSGPRDVDGERQWVPGPQLAGAPLPSALRIVRQSVSRAHGETGLRQPLNLDVSGYRSLTLEAWVRLDYADLSGGGQLGSEYPLMLRVHYEGLVEGSRPDWVHGFYYANPENRPVINAEQWPQGEWKLYRVDLMDVDDAHRPYRLIDLEVMGQGHSYDARVTGLRLIGD